MTAARAGRLRRWWWPLRLAGTVVALTLLLRSLDLGGVAHSLRHADGAWVIRGVALSAVSMFANVAQWGMLLRGTGHPLLWRTLTGCYLRGLCVGQVVPEGGDLLRTVEVGRVTGAGAALAAVGAGRMTGAVAMALGGVAGAAVELPTTGLPMLAGGLALVALLGVGGTVALWLPRVLRPVRGDGMAVRLVHSLAGALDAYRRRPRLLLRCLLTAAGGWLVNLCALQAFALAVGLHMRFSLLAVAVPATLIAGLFPLTVNGLGVREGVMVGVLVAGGAAAASAGALAVMLDLQCAPFALVGAGLWAVRPFTARDGRWSAGSGPIAGSTQTL